MRLQIFILCSLMSVNAFAEIRAVEGMKNLIKSKQENSASTDYRGKCENLNKEVGPHEILRKISDHQYLAGVDSCQGRSNCQFDDMIVVETVSTDFQGPSQLSGDLWVERLNKKIKVTDAAGFPADYVVMRESQRCAVEGSIQAHGQYAIAFAAKEGNLALVKDLVESKGQNVNVQDATGMSALDIAASKNRSDVLAYLKSKGAKPGKAQGQSKLAEKFTESLTSKNLKAAKEIMRSGLDPNAKHEGAPVLYIAVRFGDMEMIKYLAEHGAKVDATDEMNITALIVAAHNGKKEAVQYLISKKADVNHIGDGGRSPTSVAAEQGHNDIVKILKAAGAD